MRVLLNTGSMEVGGGDLLTTSCTSIRLYLVNIYCMELFTVLLSYLVNYTHIGVSAGGSLRVWGVPQNLLNKQI